jgi:GNAT superfamily N-acetyltransferase
VTRLEVHPLTPDRWDDFLALAGERGLYSGCWCMWWRVSGAEFSAQAGAGLKARLQQLVDDGREPGLLGYRGGEPVGWVSVAPREEFGRLERSPKLRRVDDTPVWSIACFYVDPAHRHQGVGRALLDAAVVHARRRGARTVEGYPIDPSGFQRPPDEATLYTGELSVFLDAGFEEVERRGGRPIVRRLTSGRRRPR